MSRFSDFLKECGTFFLLTATPDGPEGRPFGAVMEREGDLVLATSREKSACEQMLLDPRVQIVALKPGTRQWMRLRGRATPWPDLFLKEQMLEECPALKKHFSGIKDENFVLFRIKLKTASLHTEHGIEGWTEDGIQALSATEQNESGRR